MVSKIVVVLLVAMVTIFLSNIVEVCMSVIVMLVRAVRGGDIRTMELLVGIIVGVTVCIVCLVIVSGVMSGSLMERAKIVLDTIGILIVIRVALRLNIMLLSVALVSIILIMS